ncbi:small ribosomal subunit Rsm22 family protein [soil metagenome]
MLPPYLTAAIERECAAISGRELAAAAAQLSDAYRDRPHAAPGALSAAQRLAYIAVRMPATFAAVTVALAEVARVSGAQIGSVLDLGSGPGTALFSAAEIFPAIAQLHGFESDREFTQLAKRIVADAESSAARNCGWTSGNLERANFGELPESDLVIAAYSLGEIREDTRRRIVEGAWSRAQKMIVIVEPGTVAGYRAILSARETLIGLGAHVVAPCPNALPCPLRDGPGWCHFVQRLSRSRLHRLAKGAELGYEDEKFSYVAFAREPAALPRARIVGATSVSKARVVLPLCHDSLYGDETIQRRDEGYKAAKKAEWGDAWNEEVP